jgi:hypothetical protein
MKYIPNGVTRTVARQLLLTRKNSPQIMFVGGIVGVSVSTVLACKATLKLSDQLDKMKGETDRVKELRNEEGSDVSDKDVAYIYARNAAKVARLYAPAAFLGMASVGALTGAHVTLNRRNAGLTAAYAAMAKAYDEYRDRVKEELGDERENDIYHNAEVEKIKGEDGKMHEVKVSKGGPSVYSRYYDETSINWERNPEANRMFIEVQQKHANDMLKARGHIFLNEVYDMLGLERSKAGQVVGWIWNPGDEERDNYVDFGLYEVGNERFINALERTPLLDFNVDGVIYDLI